MFETNIFEPACQAIKEASSFLILLPPEPSQDLIASGLGLYSSLQSTQKPVQIGCSGPIKFSNEEIPGIAEIRESVGDQNLSIAFDFTEDDLDKVDYDIDKNGKFILLIKPKKGHQPPDASQVKFSYSGASADLVITLGINSLAELGKLYADEKTYLDSAKIINIKTSLQPGSFASIHIHQPASSHSEITSYFIKTAKLHLSSEAAGNLLTSITAATRQFATKATADTFEVAAFLMRSGASLESGLTPAPTFTFGQPQTKSPLPFKKSKIFRMNKPKYQSNPQQIPPTSPEPVSRF